MFALFSRILKLAGPYKGRIQGAFVCAFVESILSKMPIFLAFVVLSGFAAGTLTGQTCLYVGPVSYTHLKKYGVAPKHYRETRFNHTKQ